MGAVKVVVLPSKIRLWLDSDLKVINDKLHEYDRTYVDGGNHLTNEERRELLEIVESMECTLGSLKNTIEEW